MGLCKYFLYLFSLNGKQTSHIQNYLHEFKWTLMHVYFLCDFFVKFTGCEKPDMYSTGLCINVFFWFRH